MCDEMTTQPRAEPAGLFDVRYRAFLETVVHLRTPLHRYCARLTGSVLDGEDVMQEALFEAYRKIDLLDDQGSLRAWLYRIAHNRCIDFLRQRDARQRTEGNFAEDDIVLPVETPALGTGRAIEHLVINLPPKERACVLLKDVFDHSLEEIAELGRLDRGRGEGGAEPWPGQACGAARDANRSRRDRARSGTSAIAAALC